MSNGDLPIYLSESNISMADAARLARIEEKTIRNWIAREVLDIGQKIGPRWTFNFLDVLQLKVAAYLVRSVHMEPMMAAKIAPHIGKFVADRAVQSTERNPITGRLTEIETGYQHWQSVLVGFNDDKTFCTALTGVDPSRRDPPRYVEDDWHKNWLHRPYITVPCDGLTIELMLDMDRLRDGLPLGCSE